MSLNKIKKPLLIALVMALLTDVFTGCSSGTTDSNTENADAGAAAAGTRKSSGNGFDQDSDIMDTMRTAWYSDALIYIHDRLITRDYEFNYKPGLAESWDI